MGDRAPGYVQRTVVDVGLGAHERLSEHLERLGATAPVLIIDRGVRESAVGAQVPGRARFTQVVSLSAGEPTEASVGDLASALEGSGGDAVVAVGGGSTLDTVKLARAQLATRTSCLELPDPLDVPLLPMIAVPTTAGTGSELGAGAVVFDPAADDKVLIKRPVLAADVATCDGLLTLGLPPSLTATTGLDALAQAILAYVAAGPRSVSGLHAKDAVDLLFSHLPKSVIDGDDPANREAVMLGSVTSALAMFNAPPTFGAEHVFAEPLGAALRIPHSHIVAALLAPVAQFNLGQLAGPYADLAQVAGVTSRSTPQRQAAEAFVEALSELVRELAVEPPQRPDDEELETALDRLFDAGAFAGNPRTVERRDLDALLEAAFDGSFRLSDRFVEGSATGVAR